MSRYTFSALTVDGERTYPLQFKWEDPQCPPNVGMLDFLWTPIRKLTGFEWFPRTQKG